MVKVLFDWKEHDIDLNKPAPFELLEKNFKGQMYVPVSLVRELSRRLWRQIKDMRTSNEVVWASVLIKCWATIVIDWVDYEGTAQDLLPLTQLQKTMFPASARVLALAIKSALKRKFLFFESDYFWLQSEEIMGEVVVATTTPTTAASATDIGSLLEKIWLCTSVSELELIGAEIKGMIDSAQVSPEQASTLRKAYNNKNQLL
jgi:hypothetical protein